MTNDQMLTPEQFRAIRRGLDLTQAELAERLGCTNVHICRIEKGVKPLSPAFALAIEALRMKAEGSREAA